LKKTLKVLSLMFVAAGYAALPAAVWAVDPMQAAPTMYKLAFENERVRVMEVSFKPGETSPDHSHPEHFVYVLQAGQLTISRAGKPDLVAEMTAGQVVQGPAETHRVSNSGTTPVKLLVAEFKGSAPAAAPAKKAK